MGNSSSPAGVRKASLFLVLLILSVYSFPYLATTVALKSRSVPFSFAADLSLYLNLSVASSSHVNPYFGTAIQPGGVGYSIFDLAFRLLGLLIRLVNHDLWSAVLIWNLFWWTAACVCALWFLRVAFPDDGVLTLWAGMSLLFFLNFGVVKSLLLAWLHFPSITGFGGLLLPDIRAVFPQTPLVLLFFYLTLQVRALHSWRWYDWVGMCFLQATGLAMFPYSTLIMAVTSGVAFLAVIAGEREFKRAWTMIVYGAACVQVDAVYLLLRLSGGPQHSHLSLVSFHPSRAFGLAGGGMVLLILVTVAVAIVPSSKSAATKWTIVGLGVATCLLMLGDTVFSPALLMSVHAGYFIHTAISLQVIYLISNALARFESKALWLRTASVAMIAVTILNGLVLSFADYRYSLPENRTTNELASALRPLHLTARDIAIARADSVDDLCAWVPLLTSAKVLFCRSAQYELSNEEKRGLYRLRQAFQLYFVGKESGEIDHLAATSTNLGQQERLAFAGEIDPADKDRWEQARASIRSDLVPVLSQVEQGGDQMQGFFLHYEKILIIDTAAKPTFVTQRLSKYVSIESESRVGGFIFYWCKPL